MIDHLFDAHAQLVSSRVVALDRREGIADVLCRGTAYVVDEVGQILGGLQLDLAVYAIHGGDGVAVVGCVCGRGRIGGDRGLLFGGAPPSWSVHCNMYIPRKKKANGVAGIVVITQFGNYWDWGFPFQNVCLNREPRRWSVPVQFAASPHLGADNGIVKGVF